MSKEKLEKFIEKEKCYKYSQDSRWHLKKGHEFLKTEEEKELEKNVFVLFESHPNSRYDNI